MNLGTAREESPFPLKTEALTKSQLETEIERIKARELARKQFERPARLPGFDSPADKTFDSVRDDAPETCPGLSPFLTTAAA